MLPWRGDRLVGGGRYRGGCTVLVGPKALGTASGEGASNRAWQKGEFCVPSRLGHVTRRAGQGIMGLTWG